MVVDTYTGIEGEPMADVLPKIDITGYFVLYFIDDVFTFSVSFTFDVTVLCFATEAVVVNSGSQAVAGKKPWRFDTTICPAYRRASRTGMVWGYSCRRGWWYNRR